MHRPGRDGRCLGTPLRRAAVATMVPLLVLLALGAPSSAQETAPATPGSTPISAEDVCAAFAGQDLTVATRSVEPFVFLEEGEEPRGFSIELWQLIAARLGARTTYVDKETVQGILDETGSGRADAGVAAVSITADRQEVYDFSTPFFASGLRLLVRPQESTSFGDSVRALFDSSVIRIGIGFLALLLAAGTLVWLIERRHNDDFPHGLVAGIGEGMWWAIVTMATVGYGDRVTRTRLGRLFSAIWIVLGLVLVAQFTATIAARLTVDELTASVSSLDDLEGERIVTVRDTAAARLLEQRRVPVQLVGSIDEMVDAVAGGRADAAVYDGPILEYQAAQDGRLLVVGDPLTLDYYGVAFPSGSPLRECVDRALIDIVEDGTWQRLHDSWFR